jgi:hypothetical protein
LISGEDSTYFILTPFTPIYLSLNFDEKLSDAITDKWFIAKEKKPTTLVMHYKTLMLKNSRIRH